MSAGERPWWASEQPTHERSDAAGEARPNGEGSGASGEHGIDVCGVCPLCAGLRVVAQTHPEVVAHLVHAARHVASAARVLLEEHERGADRADGSHRGDDDVGHEDLTRIDLD